MTDATYWKQRAEAAEQALQLARSALTVSEQRRDVLQALADLKHDEWATVPQLASRLGWWTQRVQMVLTGLARMGLVERLPASGKGPGNLGKWRLGYLVQVPE